MPRPRVSACPGVTWISCHFAVFSLVIPNSVMYPSTAMKKPLNMPRAPATVTRLASFTDPDWAACSASSRRGLWVRP